MELHLDARVRTLSLAVVDARARSFVIDLHTISQPRARAPDNGLPTGSAMICAAQPDLALLCRRQREPKQQLHSS